MANRVIRLTLVLTDQQIEMAKAAARIEAAEFGGDAGNWRGVLIGIALGAIGKRLPERAAYASGPAGK